MVEFHPGNFFGDFFFDECVLVMFDLQVIHPHDGFIDPHQNAYIIGEYIAHRQTNAFQAVQSVGVFFRISFVTPSRIDLRGGMCRGADGAEPSVAENGRRKEFPPLPPRCS